MISVSRSIPYITVIVSLSLLSQLSLGAESTQQPEKAKAPKKAKKTELVIQGKVAEKIDVSTYSYLRLKNDSSKEDNWVAVPRTDIALNTPVKLNNPIPMFGFKSKELKRSFDRLYFGILPQQAKEVADNTKGHWLPGMKGGAPHHGDTNAAEDAPLDLSKIKIKKAEGNNAVTVSELYSKKSELNSKTITVRGKIIKYTPEILGSNWVHIADGTGTLKEKNFDLTIITKDKAKLGDTVLVTGKVILEKKLEPYYFPIAVEDAQLKSN